MKYVQGNSSSGDPACSEPPPQEDKQPSLSQLQHTCNPSREFSTFISWYFSLTGLMPSLTDANHLSTNPLLLPSSLTHPAPWIYSPGSLTMVLTMTRKVISNNKTHRHEAFHANQPLLCTCSTEDLVPGIQPLAHLTECGFCSPRQKLPHPVRSELQPLLPLCLLVVLSNISMASSTCKTKRESCALTHTGNSDTHQGGGHGQEQPGWSRTPCF